MTQRNDQVTANVQIGGMINYTPCSIEVGEVTTLPAGSDATVTNSGDEHEMVLDFGIPQGAKGDTGEQGETGKSAYQAAVEAGYEGTEEQFGTSLITIDESATAAAASATAAAASATAASGSATTASNAATTATTKAGEAATSATSAATSAASAGSNATAAQNYVTQAAAQATAAATSATNAATSATNAATSASNAASMASSASTSASTASAVLEDPDFVAVSGAVEDISTVATNISDVTSVATDIAKVGAVADDLTNIGAVADDLTNIDTVAASLPDIQDKQNKVLTNSVILGGETQTTVEGALEAISEEWVKPADWVDIRSGALDNSIYLLVAHSAPTESEGTYTVATYPKFIFYCNVSNSSHTYDIYIDGVKIATQSSGSQNKVTLDWGALYTAGTVQTIYTTTHPTDLVYHIVRLTPTDSADTITSFKNALSSAESAYTQQGVLWAHYELSNPISISGVFGGENRPRNLLLEAVTAKDNKITYTVSSSLSSSGFYGTFAHCSSLVQIPVLEAENKTYPSGGYLSFRGTPLKKVIIKNNKGDENMQFLNQSNLEEVSVENGVSFCSNTAAGNSAQGATKLKRLPAISKQRGPQDSLVAYHWYSLQPTVIDDTPYKTRTIFRFYGENTTDQFVPGLKGLVVSNQAPFDGASPQINVSYTGMNRQALVNLFKSMPYNVGYTVVGSPTITDGVASGFSSSDYLKLSQQANNSIPFEMVVCFTPNSVTPQSSDGIGICLFGDAQMFISGGSKLMVKYSTGSNQWITEPTILSANTKYWGKLTYDGTNVGISISTDGTQFTTPTTQAKNPRNRAVLPQFGYVSNSYLLFGGSIDLNNTYIKINGVPWFTGKAAMTKTCSVVGCTGTADLTAEDKAIATGKGWELTVA